MNVFYVRVYRCTRRYKIPARDGCRFDFVATVGNKCGCGLETYLVGEGMYTSYPRVLRSLPFLDGAVSRGRQRGSLDPTTKLDVGGRRPAAMHLVCLGLVSHRVWIGPWNLIGSKKLYYQIELG